jgi:hypothetical protein
MTDTEHDPKPDQEGFGEATLGEAQSSDPPSDPEMIRDEADEDPAPAGVQEGEPSGAEDIEHDPAYNPDDPELKRLKGG